MSCRGFTRHRLAWWGIGRALVYTLLFIVAGAMRSMAQPTDAAPASPTTETAANTEKPVHRDALAVDTTSSTYLLQPYDLIDVDVYNEEDLHKPARLGSDGTVILPLIGSVKVGGLTVAQATDLITQRYGAGYVKNPSVLITVLQYRRSTFSLLGQVGHPGIFEIQEGAHMTILDAVSMAGGYTATAAENDVTVKRTVDGKETLFKVRAGDMAQNPEVTAFEILPGDTVVVPGAPLQQRSFSVLGQVGKPGLFTIPEGSHIMIIDAISMAGGCTMYASQSGVTIKRTTDGRTSILKVNITDIAQNPNAPPFEIYPGDTIFVPYRNSTFLITGQVGKPGIYEVAEGAHVNIIEAILMAGGYTRTAAQNSVQVKRTVDGKATTIKVRAGDMASKPDIVPFEVLPGDIITVRESIF